MSHSGEPDTEEFDEDSIKYIENLWPKYCVKCFEADRDDPITIDPTIDMIIEIYRKHNRLMKKVYGIDMPDSDMMMPDTGQGKHKSLYE